MNGSRRVTCDTKYHSPSKRLQEAFYMGLLDRYVGFQTVEAPTLGRNAPPLMAACRILHMSLHDSVCCHAMPCHALPCLAMPCRALPCHASMPCFRPSIRFYFGPSLSASSLFGNDRLAVHPGHPVICGQNPSESKVFPVCQPAPRFRLVRLHEA